MHHIQPQLIELVQRPYDAQSSRRNMSIRVDFVDTRNGLHALRLSDARDQNLSEFLQNPDAEVLNENVGQKLSYRLQVSVYLQVPGLSRF